MNTSTSQHQQNKTMLEKLILRRNQTTTLKRVYINADGDLSPPTPPNFNILRRIYRDLCRKTPKRKKPANKRIVLRILVSRDAENLGITDSVVVSNVTDLLFEVATDQERLLFHELAAQLESSRRF
jgi:hypothetical protein